MSGEGPSEPAEPPSGAASLLREAAFRCALFGAVFSASTLGVLKANGERFGNDWVLVALLTFALSAFALAPVTLLELIAKRRAPSAGRDALVALLAATLGTACALAGWFQGIFSHALVESRSYDAAASEVIGEIQRLERRPDLLIVAAALGVLAAPLVVGRIRGWGVGRILVLSLVTTLCVSAPLTLLLREDDRPVVIAFAFAAAVLLPLTASVGDRAEELVARLWKSE